MEVNVGSTEVIVRVGVSMGVGVSNGAGVGGKVGVFSGSGVDVAGAIVSCEVSVGSGACVTDEQAERSRTIRAGKVKRMYSIVNSNPS